MAGAGEGWSDSAIAGALDTSIAILSGQGGNWSRRGWRWSDCKYNPNSAPPDFRRRGGSEIDCASLLAGRRATPDGACALEEKVVELNIVGKTSDNTIGRTLKKTVQTAPQAAVGIPPDASAAFVAKMEDVLEVYKRPL